MPTRHESWPAYAALWATWLATRALAVVTVDLTPWMLNDLDIYSGWLAPLRDGTFPVGDPTWQYPPAIAPLFLSAGAMAMDFRWAFTLVVLGVDAVVMGALAWAHAHRDGARWAGPWLWAAAGLIVGSIMVVRFDVVPTLFAVGAVLLVTRPLLSGGAAALGLTVKVWPALMLLVLPRRLLPRGLAGFAVTAAATLLAFALLFRDSLSFLGNQQARGLQVESVGALPYEVHSLLGGDVAFGLKYGSIQVLMAGAEPIGLALTLVGVVLLAVLAWWRLAGRLEAVAPGDVALAAILVSVATSRVYSPQFNVWLVGLAAVAALDPRSRLRWPVVLVVGVSVLTQVVYPWSATQLVTGAPLAIAAQGLRIIGLLVATGWTMIVVLQRRGSHGEE